MSWWCLVRDQRYWVLATALIVWCLVRGGETELQYAAGLMLGFVIGGWQERLDRERRARR